MVHGYTYYVRNHPLAKQNKYKDSVLSNGGKKYEL